MQIESVLPIIIPPASHTNGAQTPLFRAQGPTSPTTVKSSWCRRHSAAPPRDARRSDPRCAPARKRPGLVVHIVRVACDVRHRAKGWNSGERNELRATTGQAAETEGKPPSRCAVCDSAARTGPVHDRPEEAHAAEALKPEREQLARRDSHLKSELGPSL